MPGAFDPEAGRSNVFAALVEARARHGGRKPILEDQDRNPLSYTDLIRAGIRAGQLASSGGREYSWLCGRQVGVAPAVTLSGVSVVGACSRTQVCAATWTASQGEPSGGV